MTDIFVSSIGLCITVGFIGYILWMAMNLPDDIELSSVPLQAYE